MAEPPIVLPGITWLILHDVSRAYTAVGAGVRANPGSFAVAEEQALTLLTAAPITLSHVTTTLESLL
jgi:hypothetical protein